jgi:hypothetical protein
VIHTVGCAIFNYNSNNVKKYSIIKKSSENGHTLLLPVEPSFGKNTSVHPERLIVQIGRILSPK